MAIPINRNPERRFAINIAMYPDRLTNLECNVGPDDYFFAVLVGPTNGDAIPVIGIGYDRHVSLVSGLRGRLQHTRKGKIFNLNQIQLIPNPSSGDENCAEANLISLWSFTLEAQLLGLKEMLPEDKVGWRNCSDIYTFDEGVYGQDLQTKVARLKEIRAGFSF